MATNTAPKLLTFESASPTTPNESEHRHGRLVFRGRTPMGTPNFIAVSSRGAVPHLSQDMMREQTSIGGLYTALEDFIEKAAQGQVPAAYNVPATTHESPLRKFIALQRDALLVLGPRRIPPLQCPASSTSTAISIVTALGFSMLESADYVEAVQNLRPDIVIGMGDVLQGHKPGVKRADKMGDRTLAWVEGLVKGMEEGEFGAPNTALFAPILPIDRDVQSWYLNALRDELHDKVSGLALYTIDSVEAIPRNLQALPRLYVGELSGPHQLLDAIAAGIDVFAITFINEVTDAGIALDFSFASPSSIGQTPKLENGLPLPLGLDLWSSSYATDLSPLRTGCVCYACTSHHRAYLQHLLNAKEMLGWVLLQVHNHHTIDIFLAEVRSSILQCSFEDLRRAFEKTYQRGLPAKTGQAPRARGYTYKSEGKGEARKNPAAWSRELNDGNEKLAESALPDPDADASDLEKRGFAEKAD